ncbi:MAG: hypothetical protein COV31_01395 [Candidatus Yanofskybacteria bacterium CG10_big_fil_rev_8_21_14_0_10_46_23]|uniref:FAD/NAD(P)-binding domain-containing protein n=1 Tax=Candidatus Yanofskybacteria bacterium CG10_big_fil_rev_8_21_14_0_10_46_23 TaxID=1975098 RepID=A0A2H0R4Q2_9BACT|nr:MAG: hypothetical protein COV31_01395 [Candidatus Yanofskybacteria bacterium CG10_big_fil_rev_8_21_14_0_10_46_23]
MHKNVVVIGGGFGGIQAAKTARKKLGSGFSVAVIDRSPEHLFYPSLYEIASASLVDRGETDFDKSLYGVKLRSSVSISFSQIFFGTGIDFLQAQVKNLNIEKREISLGSGEVVTYDYLVLALGAERATFGIPGVEEYAYGFHSINDALLIHRRMHQLHEAAKKSGFSKPIKIVIGGAGFSGIELAAEMVCCSKVFGRMCGADKICTEITLVEAGKMLTTISNRERQIVRQRLRELKIKVLEDRRIKKITATSLIVNEGEEIEADLIIWTAGVKASTFVSNIIGLHTDDRQRIIVDKYLQAKDAPRVYAIGDNAGFIDPKTQKTVPGLAYVASQQGKIAGYNIASALTKADLKKQYIPEYDAWVLPVGAKYAVAHLGRYLSVAGFFGWVIRMLIDLRYFVTILPFFAAVKLFYQDIQLFIKNDK